MSRLAVVFAVLGLLSFALPTLNASAEEAEQADVAAPAGEAAGEAAPAGEAAEGEAEEAAEGEAVEESKPE